MARLRRRWRLVKWAGFVLSPFIVAAWTGSLFVKPTFVLQNLLGYYSFEAALGDGVLSVDAMKVASPDDNGFGTTSFHIEVPERLLRWVPRGGRTLAGYFGGWGLEMPLWIPFLLILIPTAYLWWTDRRIPLGHCQDCGYSLTGNVSGICPECGEKI